MGAGRQGLAAAYDIARFGKAENILMVDVNGKIAQKAARRINELVGESIATFTPANMEDKGALSEVLKGVDSILSAVPYKFNLDLTRAAINLGANMVDLGGHTGIVRKQLALDLEAQKSGASIIPDCGMGPGMNISLATYVMSLLDEPREVRIWDGGLPCEPIPPWNYNMTFNINGLTNEYYGDAFFLRDGNITEVPCFSGYEVITFPEPIGELEAFVTSGGLSTAPWTFKDELKLLENKTLRYIGHRDMFRAYGLLGLFEEERIKIGENMVQPREVFHTLLEPKISVPTPNDVAIMRVTGRGLKNGVETEIQVDLVDRYDEGTGFTAMQRLTGWHASIILILATQGDIRPGAIPVERAVGGERVVKEGRKRGFNIETCVRQIE